MHNESPECLVWQDLDEAEEFRRRQRSNADSQAVLARFNGRPYAPANRQEDILISAREFAKAHIIGSLRAELASSDLDPATFLEQYRKRLAIEAWKQIVHPHRHFDDFWLTFDDFERALWAEGYPSNEDLVIAIMSKEASATVVKPVIGTTLGKRIKSLRLRCTWSQEKLGEKTGLGRDSVSRHETGRVTPTTQTREWYCDVFEKELGIKLNRETLAEELHI
jgi:DNA-binding XRE family transcriptional regulator